ncbi:MAG: molybdopterin-dependent oxidoreductase [Pseudomonadota bacterium]
MQNGIVFRSLVLLCSSLLSLPLALASPLPAPSGDVLLTLCGDIAHTNVGDEAHFDRAMLEALPGRVIETKIPWQRGSGRYEGPLLHALLERVGADAEQVLVQALNHYEAEVPVADFRRHDVILAMTRDGEPLTIREFGPLFVLYPFDETPALLTDAIRFRSVWHVERIIVP